MRFSTANCELDILLNPGLGTLGFALDTLMSTELHHRLVVFAGPVAADSGDWLLRDSVLSAERFALLLRNVSKPYVLPGGTLRVATPHAGDWHTLSAPVTAVLDDSQRSKLALSNNITFVEVASLLADAVQLPSVVDLIAPSEVVGNVRFQKPTMYVFPEGNGDSALLGIAGFNLLINGGYAQSPRFWQFVKHVERLDALLLTHWGLDNVAGVRNLLRRKLHSNISPLLGFALVPPCRPPLQACEDDNGQLRTNLSQEAGQVLTLLKSLNVVTGDVRRQGSGPIAPTVLYSKIGHGTLELYPLSPASDAKELKDLQAQFAKGVHRLSTVKVGNALIPLPNATSLAALVVWKPAKATEPIVRILFSGNCPQRKIFEALDKLKHLDFLKQPTYCRVDAAQKSAPSVTPNATTKSSRVSASARTSVVVKSQSPEADEKKPVTGASRGRTAVGQTKRPKVAGSTAPITSKDDHCHSAHDKVVSAPIKRTTGPLRRTVPVNESAKSNRVTTSKPVTAPEAKSKPRPAVSSAPATKRPAAAAPTKKAAVAPKKGPVDAKSVSKVASLNTKSVTKEKVDLTNGEVVTPEAIQGPDSDVHVDNAIIEANSDQIVSESIDQCIDVKATSDMGFGDDLCQIQESAPITSVDEITSQTLPELPFSEISSLHDKDNCQPRQQSYVDSYRESSIPYSEQSYNSVVDSTSTTAEVLDDTTNKQETIHDLAHHPNLDLV